LSGIHGPVVAGGSYRPSQIQTYQSGTVFNGGVVNAAPLRVSGHTTAPVVRVSGSNTGAPISLPTVGSAVVRRSSGYTTTTTTNGPVATTGAYRPATTTVVNRPSNTVVGGPVTTYGGVRPSATTTNGTTVYQGPGQYVGTAGTTQYVTGQRPNNQVTTTLPQGTYVSGQTTATQRPTNQVTTTLPQGTYVSGQTTATQRPSNQQAPAQYGGQTQQPQGSLPVTSTIATSQIVASK
jgi:hypothetical protein